MNVTSKRRHPSLIKLLFLTVLVVVMLVGFWYARESQPLDRTRILANRWNSKTSSPERQHDVSTSEPTLGEIEYKSQINLDESQDAKKKNEDSLLPVDRPSWVAMPDDLSSDVHRISVSSEPESSIEAARATLDQSLVDQVRGYIDRYHPTKGKAVASQLGQLNADWIKKNLAVNAPEYEAILERPIGTYHQVWTQLSIDADDRATIQSWINRLEARNRAGSIGVLFAGVIGLTSVFHVMLRITSPSKSHQ
jgi:hypothetical protein